MADLPVTPLENYGQLLSAIPLADSTIATQSAQQNVARANVGNIQAQTQGANIANQGASLRLGLLQNYLQGQQPAQSPAPAQIGNSGVDPDNVSQSAFSKYAPLPVAPPPAAIAQDAQARAVGMPETAVATYKAQVDGANQQRALAANQSYQAAETVAAAPYGSAWDTLNRVNPQAAAALKQKYANDTPEQLDADVRAFAQHIGIATHQYAGRDTDFQNGVLVDKKDGKPVLGSEQVLTGLDAGAKASAFKEGNELVTVHNSDGSDTQSPRWQQAGFHSAEAYVIAADKNARASAVSTPPEGNTSATSTPKTVTAQAPAKPASVTTDPVLKDALADPDYKLKSTPIVAGRTPTPAQLDQAKVTVAARTDLLSNAQETTNAGGQALQYLNAAKAIMDSKGAPVVGPMGAIIAKITAPFGSVDATNYTEAAKYLSNAAIQAGKGNFGKGMTQNDVSMQKDELSPSVHMPEDALRNLIESGIRNTQYGMDSAKRVRAYLATGGDPQTFADWNDKHFSRSEAVNKPPADKTAAAATEGAKSTSKSGKPIVFANGHWQYAN